MSFLRTALPVILLLVLATVLVLWRKQHQAENRRQQDLKKLNDKLQNQLSQAQHFEAVGIMAGSIVHNLNNLLSVIMGHNRLASQDLPGNSPLQKNLLQINKAGHMATDLLNEISDFNRQAEQALKPTDLSNLLRDTLKFLKDIHPSSIQINETIPARCEPVMAAATGIQQVVMNLISNSVQAIGNAPGKIDIIMKDCTVQKPHRAIPRDLQPGNYIQLTVRDNGRGMDRKSLDRIFNAFSESPRDTTRLGLGLNTVFRILDEHKGVTIPSSQSGQGTSFDIYFPKIAWQVPAAPHLATSGEPAIPAITLSLEQGLAPADPGDQKKGVVLLVDDEEMVARVTTIGLQRMGYRVIKHVDSRRALADFLETPKIFDVVITDQIMPHMSGVRLARKIHHAHPSIPVILMTGFRDSFNEHQILESGISQVVLKPASHRDLAEVIETVRLRSREARS